MELNSSSETPIPVLALSGRFDARETAQVREWIMAQTGNGQAHLCVNLAGVYFIDSSALSVLVQGLKKCRENGGDLVLCCLPESIQTVFQLTRLDKAFRIFTSQDEALGAV